MFANQPNDSPKPRELYGMKHFAAVTIQFCLRAPDASADNPASAGASINSLDAIINSLAGIIKPRALKRPT